MSSRNGGETRSRTQAAGCRHRWRILGALLSWALPLAASAQFTPLANVSEVTSGAYHSCALTFDGGVLCWGENANFQLGDGTNVPRMTPVPVQGLSEGVGAIRAGEFHTCAIMLSDGSVKCWGFNNHGQLGDGTALSRATPVDVAGLTGIAVLSTGRFHTCAATDLGAATCWGHNEFGQLGDGTTIDRNVPTPVSGLDGAVFALSAAEHHTCAVHNGAAKCWGRNNQGALGDNTIMDRLVPTTVFGLGSGVFGVTAGSRHSCAFTSMGTVLCWGRNFEGQLGDGTQIQRDAPVAVLGPSYDNIQAGFLHTCGVISGTPQCWGYNNKGQVGNGDSTNQLSPVAVSGISSGVTSIAPRFEHTCAVVSDHAQCWGSNERGQLGSNDGVDHLTPTSVLLDTADVQVDVLTPNANDDSTAPATDASGRYVVFQSEADFPGVTNTAGTADVYLVDTEGGGPPLLISRSTGVDGLPLAGAAMEPSVSADGGLVAFVTPDLPTNKFYREPAASKARRAKAGTFSVVMRNRLSNTTQSMSIQGLAGGVGTVPRLSAEGNALVYTAPNQGSGGGATEVYKVPLLRNGNDVMPGTPVCVSCKARNADGSEGADSDGASSAPVVSADGRYVAFQTSAKNLVPGAPSPCPSAQQIVLADLLTGINQRMATPASAATCGSVGASKPEMDWSGRKLVFETDQPLDANDAGTTPDVYFVDLIGNSLSRISQTLGGTSPNGISTAPRISGDGSTITFVSDATDLDLSQTDTDTFTDVHIRSLRAGEKFPRRLAKAQDGSQSNGNSNRPALNYNGTQLVFDSAAGNLDNNVAPGILNVFRRRSTVVTELIFTAGFD